jgi:hypothetical protein
MSMRSLSKPERPSRRTGEILSFLFLALLGTVATLTSVPVGGHAQADAPISITPLSSATGH